MNRKVLTVAIITLGLVYVALAAMFLYTYREVASVLRGYGLSDTEINSFESLVAWRRRFLNAAIFFSCVGGVTLVLGIGVSLTKRWAGRAWLVFTIFLFCLHVYRLVEVFSWGAFWIAERIVELVLVVALAIFSWKVLSIRTAKPLPSTSATYHIVGRERR